MTKDKKGITLVSLAVTLIVMLIIFGVTLVSATVLLDNSKLTKIETTLYLVKARAETLLEQYMFDGEAKTLVQFSRVESKYPNSKVTAYNSNPKYFYYYLGDTEIDLKTNDLEFFSLKPIKDEEGTVNKIYSYLFNGNEDDGEYNELIKTNQKDENNSNIYISRFLFVKWGLNECISQGIYKENDKDAIVNDTDYIIVAYDLYGGNVSVAYSKGYKKDGKIAYTLDDMLKIDEEEEE